MAYQANDGSGQWYSDDGSGPFSSRAQAAANDPAPTGFNTGAGSQPVPDQASIDANKANAAVGAAARVSSGLQDRADQTANINSLQLDAGGNKTATQTGMSNAQRYAYEDANPSESPADYWNRVEQQVNGSNGVWGTLGSAIVNPYGAAIGAAANLLGKATGNKTLADAGGLVAAPTEFSTAYGTKQIIDTGTNAGQPPALQPGGFAGMTPAQVAAAQGSSGVNSPLNRQQRVLNQSADQNAATGGGLVTQGTAGAQNAQDTVEENRDTRQADLAGLVSDYKALGVDNSASDESRQLQRDVFNRQTEILNRILDFDPSQYQAQQSGQALSNALALAKSTRGGAGAVQAGMFAAQQRLPEFQAQAAQNAAALENQRLQLAGNVAAQSGQTATETRTGDTQQAQFDASFGKSIADSISQVTGTKWNLDSQDASQLGTIAMGLLSSGVNLEQISSQELINLLHEEVSRQNLSDTLSAHMAELELSIKENKPKFVDYLLTIGKTGGSLIAGLAGSDVRIKRNIHPLHGELEDMLRGMPEAQSWEYQEPDKYGQGAFTGHMAQDLESHPMTRSSVIEKSGVKMVDTGRVAMLGFAAAKSLQRQMDELKSMLEM